MGSQQGIDPSLATAALVQRAAQHEAAASRLRDQLVTVQGEKNQLQLLVDERDDTIRQYKTSQVTERQVQVQKSRQLEDKLKEVTARVAKTSDEASNWKPYKDPETDSIFWYNSVTLVSPWDCPAAVLKQRSQPSYQHGSPTHAPPGLGSELSPYKDDDNDGIYQVTSADDLGI